MLKMFPLEIMLRNMFFLKDVTGLNKDFSELITVSNGKIMYVYMIHI